MYLLDTNVISEAIAVEPDPGVVRKLARYQHESVTGAPVWHELMYGCLRLPPSARRERLLRFVDEVVRSSLEIVPYDEVAAARHAAERARLESLGRSVPFVDGQIAAIAQVRGLVLVTRNVRDFEPFEDLQIEDWFEG